jgi:hypothetical protein
MAEQTLNQDGSSSQVSQLVESISQDIGCPNCQYNLRGLYGPEVDCPECGCHCDIVKLISEKWTKPWYRAPKFTRVGLPARWTFIMLLISLIFLMPLLAVQAAPFWLLPLMAATYLAIWGVLIYRAATVFGDIRSGIGLALLLHVCVLGYLFGLLGFAVLSAIIIESFVAGVVTWPALIGIAIGSILAAAAWPARLGERYVANCCIREYLKRKVRE